MEVYREIRTSVSPEKVWKLITESEYIQQYMFGVQLNTKWEVGAKMTWDGPTEDGSTVTYVKGELLDISLGNYLEFTLFPSTSDIEDLAKNYLKHSYEISEEKGSTVLKITQSGFGKAANGNARFKESNESWDVIVPLMEKILNEI